MAVLRNRSDERAWFLGRKSAEPDETIEVPDEWVEDRAPDGTLLAGLDPDDLYWERIDQTGLSRAEFDATAAAPETPASADVVEASLPE